MAAEALLLSERQTEELNSILKRTFDELITREAQSINLEDPDYSKNDYHSYIAEAYRFVIALPPEEEAAIRTQLRREVLELKWPIEQIRAAESLLLSSPDFREHIYPRQVLVVVRDGIPNAIYERHGQTRDSSPVASYSVTRDLSERMPYLSAFLDSFKAE